MESNPVNQHIASRVRALRAACGLSLEALALKTGVSRSTLSLIERAETSPTAALLDKLAAGLGVTLSSLFEDPARRASAPQPLARLAEQPIWVDPLSGYRRRSVSPAGADSPLQIVEVDFPPGARVLMENPPRDFVQHQQIWLLAGAMDIGVGAQTYRLQAGDCLAFRLDQPTQFHNPGSEPARYAVMVVAEAFFRR
ncbi:helix-turn-helix domain-containing protein [Roseateles oligotrophus]|uniref:XRE family transcriptional regulator n=1 Tax=Roseateles oligotrophus TaxID=1769250 RepID=A0ABT2YKZ5_9BURK|nr:XRE family transcriptional regulator [Roseateles oligotrophus]MCV2370724.1 XRE family transcriptional regulator [Roseateles oligotrophus]